MRDRGNQIVFGIYIATFVYALLILRQVRAEEGRGDEFVPALSVTLGLLLVLLCVGLLIYFIHHTASSLQISTITEAIRRDLRDGMARLYPTEIATPSPPESSPPPRLPDTPPVQTLRAPTAGFLRHVEAKQLLDTLPVGVTVAYVRSQVGEYIFEGAPLIDIWASGPLAQETVDTLLLACTLGKERSVQQDPLFGIRQLSDIALKALSPGINDPTTAENCLAHLGDTLAQLAARPFPEPWRRHEASGVLLFLNRPDFATIVEGAFGQIRREAADDVHVTNYLLTTLAGVVARIEVLERARAIRQQAQEVLVALDQQPFTARDQAFLRERAAAVLTATDLALVGR